MNLEWMDDARCREIGGDVFFPEAGTDNRQAINVCKACPVIGECLDYALASHAVGIWGGTSERERRRLRRFAA